MSSPSPSPSKTTPTTLTSSHIESWIQVFHSLPPYLQSTALEDNLPSLEKGSRACQLLLSKLLQLERVHLSLVLEQCTQETIVCLFGLSSTDQLAMFCNSLEEKGGCTPTPSSTSSTTTPNHDSVCPCIEGIESLTLSLDYTQDPEEGIPPHIIERGDNPSSECFLSQIGDIMHTCSDVGGEPLPGCVVLVKDALGDWLRSSLGPLGSTSGKGKGAKGRNKNKITLESIGTLFPNQFKGFCKWLEAKKDGNTLEELEEVGMLVSDSTSSTSTSNGNETLELEPKLEIEIEDTPFLFPCLNTSLGSKYRLETFNRRTVMMSCKDYTQFSARRTVSLTCSPKDRRVFCSWIGVGVPSSGTLAVHFMGYIAWERIEMIMELATRVRDMLLEGKSKSKSKGKGGNVHKFLPFRYEEIKTAIDILNYHMHIPVLEEKGEEEIGTDKRKSPSRGSVSLGKKRIKKA